MASLGGQFLKGFDSPSVIGETYFLYLYPGPPSTPAVAAEIQGLEDVETRSVAGSPSTTSGRSPRQEKRSAPGR